MTNDSVEQRLRQLGHEWPADESFVEGVMSRADTEPARPNVSTPARSRILRFSYLTVGTIVICFCLWWTWSPQSTGSALYAQVQAALKQVQTVHMTVSVETDDRNLHQVAETWFARGQGFAVRGPDHVRIDNGIYFWNHQPGSDTASRTKSRGTDELLDGMLNIREELERNCKRHPDLDRRIDGVDHSCYQVTFHGSARPADKSFFDFDKQRTLVFINPKMLPKRVERQEKVNGKWRVQVVRTWEFDVPVGPDVFEPSFGAHVRVIDTDEAFERLTDVKDSVHTELRDGLIYTIHQAKRFENGGVMVVSSVRGTEETLQNFPLTRRMTQPGLYITDGPATNYEASPQGSGYFRLSLAQANHNGIEIEWWMMVPRARKPDWFENEAGQVQLKLGITPRGEYAEANHADARGVIHHIYWDLALDIARSNQLPSLKEVAEHVHADMNSLGSSFSPRLHMGIKDIDGVPNQQAGTTDEVSPGEFAAATQEHLRWWERGDVDFQLKQGATSEGDDIGSIVIKPAVFVDYYSVVNDTTLEKAAERTGLVRLSVRATSITDDGLAHLTRLNALRHLNVADTSITDDGLRHLQTIASLQSLNVAGTGVTQSGVDRLRKSLPNIVITADDGEADAKPTDSAPEPDVGPQPLLSEVSGVVVDSTDQPVANALVTVLVRRFSKTDKDGKWASVTDSNGQYSISPTGTIRPKHDEVRIKVVADDFADVSGVDYKKKILKGTLPRVRMVSGRRITGRLVDHDGNVVPEAIVRFQSSGDVLPIWDSGPFPVGKDGSFSVSVPSGSQAAAAVYPTGFAPRFIDVTKKTDQGNIVLQQGVSLKGRVVDRNGNGVAETVVGIRNDENRMLRASILIMGTAVRTDDEGYFQLPPLHGTYTLSVGQSVADYSQQMMLDGESPPSIDPVTVDIDGADPGELILISE